MWVLRWWSLVNLLLHTLHSNGFSPVCVRSWFWRTCLYPKLRLHILQVNTLSRPLYVAGPPPLLSDERLDLPSLRLGPGAAGNKSPIPNGIEGGEVLEDTILEPICWWLGWWDLDGTFVDRWWWGWLGWLRGSRSSGERTPIKFGGNEGGLPRVGDCKKKVFKTYILRNTQSVKDLFKNLMYTYTSFDYL